MKDLPEIPIARREYTPAPKVQTYANRQRLVLLTVLLLGGLTGGGFFVWSQMNAPVVATPPTLVPTITTELQPTTELEPDAPAGLLAHRPYTEAPQSALAVVSRTKDKVIYLREAAATKFKAMTAAARQAGVFIVPISGFRDLKYQENLFNRNVARLGGVRQARKVSAPPGYSEHHTGYAIDLGDGKAPGTVLKSSFERTACFRWLKVNAARYGFELSFDRGNAQKVNYEPWHWRFIGDKDSLETFYGQAAPALPEAQG
ncbi:D-alanyl-D-alanine carboxypeptidase family protein [Candidatus Cyanaurora vandensis]|uniref:M15 family metallopeptidase n=1 Tax=Candidatus Cyanaurora vandensis TaxID=2714958 RepID=UPI0025808DC7|nr:M15 family metallopeptidase [Candidatus Cyanaurora vandensis]